MPKKNLFPTYFMWRKEILSRDKYHCQKCDLPVNFDYFSIPKNLRPRLHVHHKIPIRENPALILDVNNGITVCVYCHKVIHVEMKGL